MKVEYYRNGDYLFPNLVLNEDNVTIGKYGMLRRTFLKEHKKGWYQSMLLTESWSDIYRRLKNRQMKGWIL